MVLKLGRSAEGGDIFREDASSSDGEKNMTDFQREMLLAERHAEKLRKRQRENLLNRESGAKRSRDSYQVGEDVIDEDPFDMLNDDDIGSDDIVDGGNINTGGTLFDEDIENVAQAPAVLVNRARISKTRALHILEHPNCSKYIIGSVVRILVNADAAPGSISSQYPHLVNSHAIFKIERLVKTKEYAVYGNSVETSCDHEIQEFLGKTTFTLLGRVMTDRRSDALCKVGLNQICNAQIAQEEIKFGGELIIRDLNRAAINLRNFTFTDDDVRLILERKLFKESMEDGEFQGGRSQLIAAIQRTSHEIELLTELVKNDISKIDQLRALETRKAKLEEQLLTMKAPTRNPIFVKSCPVLRANNEPSARGGAVRKTTQPTPMIMFNNPEPQDAFSNETRKRERRSIADMSYEEQKELVLAYVQHMKRLDANDLGAQNVVSGQEEHDGWANQGLISLKAYCEMNP
ncbi:RNA polymerase-associated RTF1, putative [Babesia ovis]|uniref:RNA polymerase-associated RTF1, putative n=1 Tax=Babesia ovis TaxID=5869 RepID=A0A9W5WTK8_BABOV|nr:RNA polymerase-associated RTF1, putative [Babesia ovis]